MSRVDSYATERITQIQKFSALTLPSAVPTPAILLLELVHFACSGSTSRALTHRMGNKLGIQDWVWLWESLGSPEIILKCRKPNHMFWEKTHPYLDYQIIKAAEFSLHLRYDFSLQLPYPIQNNIYSGPCLFADTIYYQFARVQCADYYLDFLIEKENPSGIPVISQSEYDELIHNSQPSTFTVKMRKESWYGMDHLRDFVQDLSGWKPEDVFVDDKHARLASLDLEYQIHLVGMEKAWPGKIDHDFTSHRPLVLIMDADEQILFRHS